MSSRRYAIQAGQTLATARDRTFWRFFVSNGETASPMRLVYAEVAA